jgi:hypothetical protein
MTELGKYVQRPEFAGLMKPSSRIARRLLEMERRMMPSARGIYQNGNHEIRTDNYLLVNASKAYGLVPANAPDSWPAFTIPWLLDLDSLDIEHVSFGPPVWLNDSLQIKHRAAGRGPLAVSRNERFNTVYFDNHRIETQYKTFNHANGGDTYGVFGVGCLCLLSGVPGVRTSYNAKGNTDTQYYDWQHGAVVIDFDPDGTISRVDNQIRIDSFNGYTCVYNDKVYRPDLNIIRELVGKDDHEAIAIMTKIDPRLKEIMETA